MHAIVRFSSLHFDFFAFLVSFVHCGLQMVKFLYPYSVFMKFLFFLIV